MCLCDNTDTDNHECCSCGSLFACTTFDATTGLCKCEQTISQCPCWGCYVSGSDQLCLSFFCSEECLLSLFDEAEQDDA